VGGRRWKTLQRARRRGGVYVLSEISKFSSGAMPRMASIGLAPISSERATVGAIWIAISSGSAAVLRYETTYLGRPGRRRGGREKRRKILGLGYLCSCGQACGSQSCSRSEKSPSIAARFAGQILRVQDLHVGTLCRAAKSRRKQVSNGHTPARGTPPWSLAHGTPQLQPPAPHTQSI
jgi:hypothetical protein